MLIVGSNLPFLSAQPCCKFLCRRMFSVVALNNLHTCSHITCDIKHINLAMSQHLHSVEVSSIANIYCSIIPTKLCSKVKRVGRLVQIQ